MRGADPPRTGPGTAPADGLALNGIPNGQVYFPQTTWPAQIQLGEMDQARLTPCGLLATHGGSRPALRTALVGRVLTRLTGY